MTRRVRIFVLSALAGVAVSSVLCGDSVAEEGASTGSAAESLQDRWGDAGVGPMMVWIEPGQFLMGSWRGDEERDVDESPRARITITRGFYIGRTEITVAEFGAFVEDTGYQTDAHTTGCAVWEDGRMKLSYEANWANLPGLASGANYPAVCISWHDAVEYTDWLSLKTGHHYRLATEAEWEFAARAGTNTSRFWGSDPNDACEYANVADRSHRGRYPETQVQHHECDDGFAQAAPVGSFSANDFGLHDMLGNVWEWTCTAYAPKHPSEEQACTPRKSHQRRVLRGGAWYVSIRSVRSAHRNAGAIFSQASSVGARVVREPAS